MPAVYPGAVRQFQTKIDLEMTVFALHMNDVQDEITAVQTELGTNVRGSAASVKARLDAIETSRSLTTHDHANRLDTTTHDTTTRHTFGPGGALGQPVAATALTPGAASTAGTGDNPAREDHAHAFDVALIAKALIPPGTITAFGGSAAPAGWALCNGAVVARGTTSADTYYDLFQVIGTQYNTGGETGTQFRLPNLQDRFPLGRATPSATVVAGGTKDAVAVSHNHTQDAHAHAQDAHSHGMDSAGDHEHTQEWQSWWANQGHPDVIAVRSSTGPFRAATGGDGWLHTFTRIEYLMNHAGSHTHGIHNGGSGGIHNATATNQAAGESGAGKNMPPYQTVNFIIKL